MSERVSEKPLKLRHSLHALSSQYQNQCESRMQLRMCVVPYYNDKFKLLVSFTPSLVTMHEK